MARFTAASISGSERSTRLRKWNRLVLARFTAVEATISTEEAVVNDRALAVAGQFLEDAGQFLEDDAGQFLPCNCQCSDRWEQLRHWLLCPHVRCLELVTPAAPSSPRLTASGPAPHTAASWSRVKPITSAPSSCSQSSEFRVYSSLTRQTDQESPISRSWRATVPAPNSQHPRQTPPLPDLAPYHSTMHGRGGPAQALSHTRGTEISVSCAEVIDTI